MSPQLILSTVMALGMLVSLGISVLSFVRSGRKDDAVATDKRIDERIRLKFGEDIAVIKSQLAVIQTTLSNTSERDAALVKGGAEAAAEAINSAARMMALAIDTKRTPAGEPRISV